MNLVVQRGIIIENQLNLNAISYKLSLTTSLLLAIQIQIYMERCTFSPSRGGESLGPPPSHFVSEIGTNAGTKVMPVIGSRFQNPRFKSFTIKTSEISIKRSMPRNIPTKLRCSSIEGQTTDEL